MLDSFDQVTKSIAIGGQLFAQMGFQLGQHLQDLSQVGRRVRWGLVGLVLSQVQGMHSAQVRQHSKFALQRRISGRAHPVLQCQENEHPQAHKPAPYREEDEKSCAASQEQRNTQKELC